MLLTDQYRYTVDHIRYIYSQDRPRRRFLVDLVNYRSDLDGWYLDDLLDWNHHHKYHYAVSLEW